MSSPDLPDGPTKDEIISLLRDAFPDAVVAEIDSAAFFSLDESHWPNFATVVWTDEHDIGAPSNLARDGVYRVNVGVDPATFKRLVGEQTDARGATLDYAALDTVIPHPVYAKQRWIAVLNPSHDTVRETLMPLIAAGHDRLAKRGTKSHA
ncbi:MAG TPA: DUF6194 family protein [Candidatus Limnocylindria bacterium]|nr:DUF6194 family protein [Candidatus Limnocylindria bacterium]